MKKFFSFTNSKNAWYAILFIHILLCLVAFNKAWVRPDNYLFANHWDGMKNYFTMESYLRNDSPKGILHWNESNYPFGEYIYYTDNTPLFCLFIKLFSRYLFNIVPYSIYLFHLLTVVNILLAARLSWLVARRFIQAGWLCFLLAIAIPWCNIQITRIEITSNLSYSSLLLAAIYLLVLIFENSGQLRKLIGYWLWLLLLCSGSFFIHGYYIALIGIPIIAFHFFWFIVYPKRSELLIKVAGALVPIIAIIISYSIVNLTDPWIGLRAKKAEGYDWINWKTQFLGLFTAPHYNDIKFPLSTYSNLGYESSAYLGAFILYGYCLVLFYVFYKGNLRSTLKKYFTHTDKGILLCLLFFTGLLSLVISFGNEYDWPDTGIKFINVINPFYWLIDYFPMIRHFRTLGRFSWLFYFPAIFSLAWLMEQSLFQWNKSKVLKGIVTILLLFIAVDTYDYVRHLNGEVHATNPLRKEALDRIPVTNINFKQYQAILPIPYFNTGSEDYDYTIDGMDNWIIFNYALNTKSGLPLMSCSLSRTAVYQSHAFINTFVHYKLDSAIVANLNAKPILVVVDRRQMSGWDGPTQREPAHTACKNMKNFVDSLHMPLIMQNDSLSYYSWNWKK